MTKEQTPYLKCVLLFIFTGLTFGVILEVSGLILAK